MARPRRVVAVACAGLFRLATASTTKNKAISLPATNWAGIDGNWSTVELQVGSESGSVDVLIATALSEIWVVGTGGCYEHEPHCSQARHGIFNPAKSGSWDPLGSWQLGLEWLGYGANGDYGQDRIKIPNDVWGGKEFSMPDALISTINTTDYFLGQFGLGITHGNFDDKKAPSPLTAAVETYGLIPSYSYGYTAGAHYRNTPASVTLGGYDLARFINHDVEFSIPLRDTNLRALVRGIGATAGSSQDAPEHWDGDTLALSEMDDAFHVLFDSATPFMWLPDSICDSFADAFNLTYDDSLDLYNISNDQYREFQKEDSHEFVFSLSAADNRDDFGDPLNMRGVVNITIPIQAFISVAEYPFKGEAIEYGSPSVPYFSLRRAGDNATFVLGRSFLQEAYLLTQYDKALFSVHQAKFPDEPHDDADIVPIEQPVDTPYPLQKEVEHGGLTIPQIAGIVIGISAAVLLTIIAIWFWWRRRRQSRGKRSLAVSAASSYSDLDRRSAKSMKSPAPEKKSPMLSRMMSKLRPNKRANPDTESRSGPTEVANNEIYELPAATQPVELHSGDRDEFVDDRDALGLTGNQDMSAYEQERLRLDRQLAGPVPEYSPPADGVFPVSPEKNAYTFEQTRPVTGSAPSPQAVSPQAPDSTGSNTFPAPSESLVSPISPWENGSLRFGSSGPGVVSQPSENSRSQPRTESNSGGSERSRSEQAASITRPQRLALPQGVSQRTPIDPSRVVCLGPLPENLQLTHQNALPTSTQPPADLPLSPPAPIGEYAETLGSDFTDDEDRLEEPAGASLRDLQAEERQREQQLQQAEQDWETEQAQRLWNIERQREEEHYQRLQRMLERDRRLRLQTQGLINGRHVHNRIIDPDNPENQDRIDSAAELIHVPQPAQRRYSWEFNKPQ